MGWQDIVITICILSFSYALIPQIALGHKQKKSLISKQTSLITALGMATLSIVYITLGLVFSTIMALITTILWTILLAQSKFYPNHQ